MSRTILKTAYFFAEEGIRSNLVRLLEKAIRSLWSRKNPRCYQPSWRWPQHTLWSDLKQAIFDAITQKAPPWRVDQEQEKQPLLMGIIAVYSQIRGLIWKRRQICPFSAAPTGRVASSRMNELTGLPSATIHRHLGMTEDDDSAYLDDYLMLTLSSWTSFPVDTCCQSAPQQYLF